jgi:hypothetical protein
VSWSIDVFLSVELRRSGLPAVGARPRSALGEGASGPLPRNLEPEIERQVARVLILADEPILKRPFVVALVEDALPHACEVDRPVCERVKRCPQRYSRYHACESDGGCPSSREVARYNLAIPAYPLYLWGIRDRSSATCYRNGRLVRSFDLCC